VLIIGWISERRQSLAGAVVPDQLAGGARLAGAIGNDAGGETAKRAYVLDTETMSTTGNTSPACAIVFASTGCAIRVFCRT
jgi:hypothetical protein